MAAYTTHAQDVTEAVELWIRNDGVHYERALVLADHWREWGSEGLSEYLIDVLQTARPHTPQWYVARTLSANDYDLIDWDTIAEALNED